MNTPNNSFAIGNYNGFLAIAGAVAIIAGMVFNAYLFTTYADGLPVYIQSAMAGLGVVLDVIKISLIVIIFTILIPTGKYSLAGFAGLFALLLTGLSLFSGFGAQVNVLSNSESAMIEKSQVKLLAQKNYENAQSKLDSLQHAAGLNSIAIQNEIDTLLNSYPMNSNGRQVKSTLGDLTGNCSNTGTWYYRYCSNYPNLQSSLQDALLYDAAKNELAEKENRLLTVGSVASDSDIGINPVFAYASHITGYDAKTIKSFIGSLISLILEFIGTLAILVANYTKRVVSGGAYTEYPMVFNANKGDLTADYQVLIGNLSEQIKSLESRISAPQSHFKVQAVQPTLLSGKGGVHNDDHPTEIDDDSTGENLIEKSKIVQAKQPVMTRADSGVNGDNSSRYKAVKKAVLTGKIKPTLQAIMAFKHGGLTCNRDIAKRFQNAMAAEGIIERYRLSNGKQSYRIVSKAEV